MQGLHPVFPADVVVVAGYLEYFVYYFGLVLKVFEFVEGDCCFD
jgi:hypothetical protein